jgi:hypothetical protein
MYSHEEVEKEVKLVFGNKAIYTLVRYNSFIDAVSVKIFGKVIDNLSPYIEFYISGLDNLRADNPIDILRSKIFAAYDKMKSLEDSRKTVTHETI